MATGLTDRVVAWRMPRLPLEERRSVMDALMVIPSGAAIWRFVVLMFLSSLIAAVGLLQNSVAVIIGAMMIAPLMTPIMGIAACLVMGWGQRLVQMLALVLVSAAAVVAVGWGLSTVLPPTGVGLPSEVVARSSPDIRDLLVALGAGAAGAFATVQKKVSAALPGVAVAVAVVPPLAAAGVLLGRGQPELARGAALLFLTNLVGIVLLATVVFLLTGLVSADRFRTHRRQILVSLAMAAVCALAVALILTPPFIALTGHARDLKTATKTITHMLSPSSKLSHIAISGSKVRADVTGPTAPPPIQDMAAGLSRALGHPVTVQLSWLPVRDPEHSRPQTPPPPLSELSPVVEKWLAAQSLTLQGLSYQSGTLVVSTAGPRPPGNSDDLTTLIDARFNHHLPVSMAWTRGAGASTTSKTALATAEATAATWVSTQPGITVLSVTGSADAVTVTLLGSTKPDVDTLRAELQTALPQAKITIQWVSGGPLAVATPTSAPPAPNPTPATGPTTPPR